MNRWVFWAFLAIVAYFLLIEHRAHFINTLLGTREEAEMIAQFGDEYRRYQNTVPAFIPKLDSASAVSRP